MSSVEIEGFVPFLVLFLLFYFVFFLVSSATYSMYFFDHILVIPIYGAPGAEIVAVKNDVAQSVQTATFGRLSSFAGA